MGIVSDLNKVRDELPPCRPPFWAKSGHLQTILGHLLPSPQIKDIGVELSIPVKGESDEIHSTYIKGKSKLVIYLFHGLGGSADGTYMHRTALLAQKLGHHVFLNNHRGCGKGSGLAIEPYHSGRAEDLSSVIAFGRAYLPDHKHLAIGFSLSGNALLLLSSGYRANILPDAAIAVNAPINLDSASLMLTQGLNRLYDKRFVNDLRRYVKENNPAGISLLKGLKTLREFDELYTAPVGGFKNRADYYQLCSAKDHLKNIKIPTVLLTAKDDPFVNVEDYKSSIKSDLVVTHIEEHGGHMGYLLRKGPFYLRWQDLALENYIKAAAVNLLRD